MPCVCLSVSPVRPFVWRFFPSFPHPPGEEEERKEVSGERRKEAVQFEEPPPRRGDPGGHGEARRGHVEAMASAEPAGPRRSLRKREEKSYAESPGEIGSWTGIRGQII